jgi:hypothetical protein
MREVRFEGREKEVPRRVDVTKRVWPIFIFILAAFRVTLTWTCTLRIRTKEPSKGKEGKGDVTSSRKRAAWDTL